MNSKSQVVDVRRQRDALLEEFLGTVKAIRSRDVGLQFPEFDLKSGVKLRNVRFTSVNANGVGLVHEQGASRLMDGDLPDDYKARYRLDLDAKVELAMEESKPKPEVEPEPEGQPAVVAAPHAPCDCSSVRPPRAAPAKRPLIRSRAIPPNRLIIISNSIN